jgi:hypothetical protein
VNQTFIFKSLLVTAVALPLTHAAKLATRDDQAAAYSRVRADYRADKAACASYPAPARDLCVGQAQARRASAQAGLESGRPVKATASAM